MPAIIETVEQSSHDTPASMPTPGPVVLASDGQGATDAPAIAARMLAERLGVRVEVITVLTPLPIYVAGADGLPPMPPEFEERRRVELESLVRDRLERVLGPRAQWTLEMRYGSPGREIAEFALERRAGIIVVGTGGHRALDRFLGEEVSLQVVRHATTPVLAVAPGMTRLPRHVLVGMDFSAASVRAARSALALLDGAGAGESVLTLVHVRSAPASWTPVYDAGVNELFTRVMKVLGLAVPASVRVQTLVRDGPIAEALGSALAETGADMLAVGTHGPAWVERLFVGSVATSMLRSAATVLVAPRPPAVERVRLELQLAGRVELLAPADWSGALDTLTRRNAGRRARLEVSDPELRGFDVEADDYRFRGAVYDEHDRRVEIVLGSDAEPMRHLTHTLSKVRSIEIAARDELRDESLLVQDGAWDAVLTFLD